jgi:hypothetical protein
MKCGLVAALALLACSSALPSERPANFRLTWNRGGGMRPEGESMQLAAGESSYESWRGVGEQAQRTRLRFTLLPEELDRIYHVLRENKIDRIRNAPGRAYDKGGYSLTVLWDGKSCQISESGGFIEPRWRDEWNRINEALDALAKREIERHKTAP